MATVTRQNQHKMHHTDYSSIWSALAVIAVVILAIACYAAYEKSGASLSNYLYDTGSNMNTNNQVNNQ